MLSSGTVTVWAANPKEVRIAGRIYDFNKSSPLHNVSVRIVNVATGIPREDQTDKDGCYEFKNVENGSYTFSVYYKGPDAAMQKKVLGEFLLPYKITVVRSPEKDILIKTCVALAEKNSLLLLQDCDLCHKVPVIWWIIPAGAVLAGAIGKGNEEETSPSRP
jgi:hypothetical protein